METTGIEAASSDQSGGGRVERLDDQSVHPLVAQPPGEGQLPLGVAPGVDDQGVAFAGQQRPADADRERLLPVVLQRPAQQADLAGAAAGQGAGDRMGLVAELAAAARTRSCVSSEVWMPRSAYDTAAGDSPVACATSRMVARLRLSGIRPTLKPASDNSPPRLTRRLVNRFTETVN